MLYKKIMTSLVYNKKHRAIAITVLLAIGVVLFINQRSNGREQNAMYHFTTVKPGQIEEVVTAQGTLEPKEYVDVGAQVSGQLKKIHVELGDIVKKGDLLAEIDPKIYDALVQADQAKLRTLQAQLAEQEAQVTFANLQYQRNKRLIKSKAISQEVLEDSDTSVKVANAKAESLKAQIEEAQSTLEGDQTNLSYTKIYAPMDGTVVVQTSREGQTLNASQTAPVIVQLANLDTMTVRAQVAEADVMRIKLGAEVYFTTLGSLERRWHGTVRQILPTPEIINNVVLYNALVDVDNKDRQLMTGMSTQMFFVLGKAENAPLIPFAALGKRLPEKDNENGQAFQVLVQEKGVLKPRMIHVGLMNRTMVEVRSGLSKEDKVAVPIKQEMDPGQRQRRMGPRI